MKNRTYLDKAIGESHHKAQVGYSISNQITDALCLGLCITRYGIQLAKKDFKVLGLLFTVVLIAVCLSMMSMS